jgi:hypothetical protein
MPSSSSGHQSAVGASIGCMSSLERTSCKLFARPHHSDASIRNDIPCAACASYVAGYPDKEVCCLLSLLLCTRYLQCTMGAWSHCHALGSTKYGMGLQHVHSATQLV